ncbi:class II aldolase [Sinorhizobium meliloti WSM1022]|jgi:rhamnose utilization protein RhaD (predicted bifunctional aldolase and dehydrogenase)|uniref:class II aldolase n=1 Tax=Rhizobium meliloti TaxID=382 RepID=UPI00042A7F76|nr:class II aldolase [Sinorhizobium meliloti]ASQ03427.1 class II aldolase [Sinorhizobium meliloti]MCO6425778.1 class II aldolase [Sinorhizobium meliloti]MDW9408375.1 class II aldolase [Sinorhizobium meliloti]MDW9442593.1 class II aldolase [Sinorhizobium meliloti]MDW9453262.1 class II aldolase [Sinorhizobium meliloti]
MLRSSEFEALLDLSARVGADPDLVQGAGGNTSIKEGGTLWIKASGLWLAHARRRDVMVPVALDPLLDALERDDPATEKAQDFVVRDLNPSGLRPSIETTVHALMPQKVVVHVHCVETIATAVHADAAAIAGEKLQGIPYAFVPYARPGLPLAKAIAERIQADTSVLVLGNHGLAVAAETVGDAARLLAEVSQRFAVPVRQAPSADLEALSRLAVNSAYRLPDDGRIHDAATDLESCRIAAGGSLYPDHVIFLGKGSVVAAPGENALSLEEGFRRAGESLPPVLLFPGKGALVLKDISAGALAMARCLSDVTARIPDGASLRYLTDAENAELLGWDAEKYRQQLNRAGQVLQ